MNEEAALLNELGEHPDDQTNRQVYADWLEEHGDLRAEYLRLQMKLSRCPRGSNERKAVQKRMRALSNKIDREWLLKIEQVPVENCDGVNSEEGGIVFHYQCPKQWADLAVTENSKVRMCGECKKLVFFCHSVREARGLARQGMCVAIESTRGRKRDDIQQFEPTSQLLGVLDSSETAQDMARDALQIDRRSSRA